MRVGVVAACCAVVGAALPAQVCAQDARGRVVEQVTPVDKGGALLAVGTNLNQAGAARLRPALAVAGDGDGVTSATLGTMLPAPAGGPPTALGVAQLYAFRRAADGTWSYRPTLPPDDLVFDSSGGARDQTLAVSGDLSRSVAVTYAGLTPASFQDQNQQPNLALVDASNRPAIMTVPDPAALPLPATYPGPTFAGASPGLETVALSAQAPLRVASGDPAVPTGGSATWVYAYRGGALHPVAVETDGTTPFPGGGQATPGPANLVSADGARVFFGASAGAAPNQLFARDLGAAPVTRPVSVSRRTTPDPNCTLTANPGAAATAPATFQGATPSGTVALFTSACELTDASTTGTSDSSPSLYAYNIATGTLTDLSIDSADAGGASVAGLVGMAADASYVWFVARGKLDGTTGVAGQNNLYVWHAGTVARLATLAAADASAWTPTNAAQYLRAQVSADGRTLLLLSAAALTGYANGTTAEAYLLRADGSPPACLSCAPSGAAPAGAAALGVGSLSPDGARAVFSTPEALVPSDANAVADVYEAASGATRLVTGGDAASQGAALVGAAADGDDVFFTTFDGLVPRDTDGAPDLYDARVGGLPATAVADTVPACAAALDGRCQGAPSPRPSLTAPSVAADGRNAAPPPPAAVAPTVRITKPTKKALAAMARTGTLRLTVRTTGPVTLKAKATARLRGRRTTIATAARRLAKAGRATLALKLSKKARATLRRTGRLTVVVAIGGGARTSTVTLKLEVRR
jgi:hypothetical protein